jgi:hypothetical protein
MATASAPSRPAKRRISESRTRISLVPQDRLNTKPAPAAVQPLADGVFPRCLLPPANRGNHTKVKNIAWTILQAMRASKAAAL